MSTPSMRHGLLFLAISAVTTVAMAENNDNYSPLVLDQVVVTATKTENSVAEAPASMAVITREEIEAQPAMALNEMVEQAVGVESRKEGGRAGRETISIRGMDSDYTLIMVNGRKMSSSNAIVRGNDFDLATIPKENIERIEIIRGPMSALYGSEALGGVVNIITRQPDNEWSSSLSTDFSTPADGNGGNEIMLGLNSGGALIDDELYLNLAVNKSDRNEWKPHDNESGMSYDRSQATAREARDTLNLSGTLNWYVNDNHALDLEVNYADDQREGMIESSKGLTATDQEVQRNNIALTHSADWSLGESQLRYYREEVELGDMNYEGSQRDVITETNHTIDGSFSTDLADHRLTLGGEARLTDLENTRDIPHGGSTDVIQQALFAQDEWLLNDEVTLTYGARIDNHDDFGVEVSPRAYLVHTVSDNLTVKGGVGKAFKAPSLTQLSEDYRLPSCKSGCYMAGNPDLKPETSMSYELAASYSQSDWEAEAAIFQNDVENLIDRDLDNVIGSENGKDLYTYKNVDEAQIRGIELGGRIALTNTLSMNGDFTFIDAKDKTTGELLTERPRQTASVKLNWQAMEKLTTFARVSYTGEQKLNDTVDIDGYSMLDLGVNYAMTDDLKLRAGVTNLTDESYDREVTLLGYNEDPRTWYVGFTSTF